ncbi:hypothetical protein [Streptomyces sp. H27-H5]|uniref:hypothetical protein n=1 Tax=Streptomyces sp. H27-H5 TaxID=2996460 RepID=UPI00226E59D2|nr:hypothetical protein [Streptomyces sp. H27-H5]MCY0962069.1 hypothetical protein [Streptomyces sp. H27-H5]
MYQHVKQKIFTLLTVVCLTVGAGAGSAVAAERDPSLLEIAARVEQYSKCRQLPLLERPKCRKEFALKSAKLGLAVGVYLHISQAAMKDGGASFIEVNKELGTLGDQLRPILLHAKGMSIGLCVIGVLLRGPGSCRGYCQLMMIREGAGRRTGS